MDESTHQDDDGNPTHPGHRESAAANVGPHLLGRKYEPDDSDWSVSDARFQAAVALTAAPEPPPASLLDETVRDAINTSPYFATWAAYRVMWNWVKKQRHPAPSPTPTPPPPPVPSNPPAWEDLIQLDQGQTGHCVGFGWAGWGDAAPIEDNLQNSDGHAIYYEAKVIDGEAKQENGSSVRSGAKAMKNRGRLAAYAFATKMSEVDAWLNGHGPVVFGTNWYAGMFNPDDKGYVALTGGNEGGHCYLCLDKIDEEGAYLFKNSWASSWGLNGYFKMKAADVARLLAESGEACFAIELPA